MPAMGGRNEAKASNRRPAMATGPEQVDYTLNIRVTKGLQHVVSARQCTWEVLVYPGCERCCFKSSTPTFLQSIRPRRPNGSWNCLAWCARWLAIRGCSAFDEIPPVTVFDGSASGGLYCPGHRIQWESFVASAVCLDFQLSITREGKTYILSAAAVRSLR